MLHSNVVNSYW